MNDADRVLADLGRQMGIEDWTFDARRLAGFEFASGRTVSFENQEDALCVFVSEPIPEHLGITECLLDALKRANAHRPSAWQIQVALRNVGNGYALLTCLRLNGTPLTTSKAEQALAFLDDWNAITPCSLEYRASP